MMTNVLLCQGEGENFDFFFFLKTSIVFMFKIFFQKCYNYCFSGARLLTVLKLDVRR